MSVETQHGYIVAPVSKALQVLTYVAERSHGVTLTAICTALDIPKTTTLRYLHTLRAAGFLEMDSRDKYIVGPKLRDVLRAEKRTVGMRELARPALLALSAEFNETVNLAVMSDDKIVYIDLIEPNRRLRMQARIGDSHPLHSTALGKAILAFLPEAHYRAYVDRPLVERTGRTLIDTNQLEQQIRRVRQLGYATEAGENEDGAMCIGAPVFDKSGFPIAAISISAPLQRMSRPLAKAATSRILRVTRELSSAVGE